MVGARRLELLTSTVSKSKYKAIQQLTGYLGLPKSLLIRDDRCEKRNQRGMELPPLLEVLHPDVQRKLLSDAILSSPAAQRQSSLEVRSSGQIQDRAHEVLDLVADRAET
jgi:hypothetical protein